MRSALLVALLAAGGLAQPGRLLPVDESSYPKLVGGWKGKVLLVNFWATWCEPCRAEMPLLVKLESTLKGRGLQLVTISADEPEDEAAAAAFLARNGVKPPSYIKRARSDDRFITSVDASWSGALPALFVYDRTGRKVKAFVGETDLKALEAAVRKLL